jgi:hypothetical protein
VFSYDDVGLVCHNNHRKHEFHSLDTFHQVVHHSCTVILGYDQAGQQGIVCDVAHGGLLCSNDKQMATGGKCFDYEVRVLCEPKDLDCSSLNVTTVAPSPGEYINPTPAPTADVFGITKLTKRHDTFDLT